MRDPERGAPRVVVALAGGKIRGMSSPNTRWRLRLHLRDALMMPVSRTETELDRRFAPRLTTLEGRTLVIGRFGHIGKEIAPPRPRLRHRSSV